MTEYRMRRGVRVLVVGLVLVLVLGFGFWVVREVRARVAAVAAAEASASATARVGDDIKVCGIVDAGVLEKLLGWQVESFTMSAGDDFYGFYCAIYSYSALSWDNMKILASDRVSPVINENSGWRSFEEIVSRPDASPLVVEGLEGRGVTLRDDNGAPAVVWEYPNGLYASVRFRATKDLSDAEVDAQTAVIVAVFTEVAHALAETKNSPSVAVTGYPD